jgi:hypothetical protein
VGRVHQAWTGRRGRVHSGPAGGADRRVLGRSNALTKAEPPATLRHGSSPVGAEKREGSTGVLFWASPELRRWCGDRAMMLK